MRILTHLCCGPCGITVLRDLLRAGHEVTAYFFNPNIHPLAEYLRRREGAGAVCRRLGVPLIFADALPPEEQEWEEGESVRLPEAAPPGQGRPLPARRFPPPAADPRPWLRLMAGLEDRRCSLCWRIRLAMTVRAALRRGFAAFTTSLLYSRRQDHNGIRGTAEDLAACSGLHFVYRDFRVAWREGVDLSRAWGIYRQPYCGCLYSEYERYAREGAKAWGV
ncbi:MAG: epoxyqueuosine reductase QueH [Desulfovibrio sp.]|nr:epoxyqueuosine reductase QueH [Desulfovibrio sp.]